MNKDEIDDEIKMSDDFIEWFNDSWPESDNDEDELIRKEAMEEAWLYWQGTVSYRVSVLVRAIRNLFEIIFMSILRDIKSLTNK